MKMVKTLPNYGPAGAATLEVLGKQVQIVMDENNEVITLTTDAFPAEINLKKLPLKNKKYMIALDSTKTKVTGFRPFSGSVIVEFVEIKKRPGQPAIHEFPRDRQGKTMDGRPYQKNWTEFTTFNKVIADEYTGMVIPVKLRYLFTPDENGNADIKGDTKHPAYLARYLECVVGDSEKVKIPFSDNILPQLEALLQRLGGPFMIVMANGWPESFGEAPAIYRKKKKLQAPAKKIAKKTAKKK